jgi:signal transduction histidine kinase
VLVVEDAGSGIASRGKRRTAGSGLGLEIARRVARHSGGDVMLGRSDLGGARVEVTLGPPQD